MNDIKWNGRRVYARRDYRDLMMYRRAWADKRRKAPTKREALQRLYRIKRSQFDMALHRRGLRSPYDYEYPRLDQMSALARELHARHIEPLFAALRAYDEE